MTTQKFNNNTLFNIDGKVATGGETAPDVDAGGLTLQQNGNDGKILTFKSTDVTLPFTSIYEADTYANMYKQNATGGGLSLRTGGAATDPRSLHLIADSAGVDTSTTTSSVGAITLSSTYTDGGTSVGAFGAGSNIFVVRNNSVAQYIFKSDGTAYSDVAWTTFSDDRLKTDQEDLNYGLTEILQLNPKRYQRHSGYFDKDGNVMFDGDAWESIGLIAQEVKEIIPEAIPKNTDDTKSFYGLTYIKLIPVLINAIKELEARVAALEA